MSFGLPVGDVASLATGIPRLVDAIGCDLFFEDQQFPPAAARPSFRGYYEHAISVPDRAGALTGARG